VHVKAMMQMMLAAAILIVPLLAEAAPPKGKAAGAARKQEAVPAGNPVWGKEKADSERCMECHGEDGQGSGNGHAAEGKFAKLAGQHPDYVLKQIRDFRSGARKHDQMAIMAKSVSDEDVRDIAAYFASLPAMKPDGSASAEAKAKGRALYEQGDAARGEPACATCHGVNGEGLPGQQLFPIIGGQEWRYLDKQLRDWRTADRKNGSDAIMNTVTQKLTDNDIQALATYLSGM
jgi:cytochrome c553